MKIIKVKYNILGQKSTIRLVFSKEKEWADYVKKEYDEKLIMNNSYGQFYQPDDQYLKNFHQWIWINEEKFDIKKLESLNTILHETQHLVVRELDDRSIKLVYQNGEIEDEIFSYFYGEVGSKILNKIYKLNLN